MNVNRLVIVTLVNTDHFLVSFCVLVFKRIMVAALVIPWRQVLALVVQATIVNNRLIYSIQTNAFLIHVPAILILKSFYV